MVALLCAVLSGAMFGLSLPPFGLSWFAWFCFSPLLVAAVGRRAIEAIGLGIVAALASGVVQAGWHGEGLRMFLAYYPFLLLAPILALLAEVGATNRRRRQGLRWTALVATFGVICEWLTRFLPMPIHLALTQYRFTSLIQIASITGVWGVSFLLWWSNAAFADFALRRRDGERDLAPLAVGALMVAGVVIFGAVRLHAQPHRQSVHAAAIQDTVGGETDGLGGPDTGGDVDRDKMTARAAANGARFIVWSEECLGAGFDPASGHDPTIALAKRLGVFLVAGFSGSERPLPYNSAALITPAGVVAGVHHKMYLYAEEKRMVKPGTSARTFQTSIGRVGMEICFDTCNTDVTRRLALSGARLIAVPTYDPPVVHGVMHNLHAALMPFRAVENGVPMIRDDSNGTSEIIDGNGRILAIGPVYAPAIVNAVVPLGDGRGTAFTRLGDWFAWSCIVYFVVVVSRRRKS